MTITKEQHTTPNYYISLEITTRYNTEVYIINVCPIYNNYCGYPIRTATYPTNEVKKAYATYKRYINKYTKE